MESLSVGGWVEDARGEASVEAFVREHWATVWRAAYAITGDRQLAEDAAQDAFVRALAAWESRDRARPLGPWLRRIAANCAVDLLRRRHGDWLVFLDDAGDMVDDWEGSDAVGLPAGGGALAAAVLELVADRRIVIVLRYWV